jgi:hypothetical protein
MKSKYTFLPLCLLAALGASCSRPQTAAVSEAIAPENGAQFRKGEGLVVTDEMKEVIGLKIVEVAEEKVARSFSVTLRVIRPADLQPEKRPDGSPPSRRLCSSSAWRWNCVAKQLTRPWKWVL